MSLLFWFSKNTFCNPWLSLLFVTFVMSILKHYSLELVKSVCMFVSVSIYLCACMYLQQFTTQLNWLRYIVGAAYHLSARSCTIIYFFICFRVVDRYPLVDLVLRSSSTSGFALNYVRYVTPAHLYDERHVQNVVNLYDSIDYFLNRLHSQVSK
jgi:hypothetical protein